jgi:small GTP-binding protein
LQRAGAIIGGSMADDFQYDVFLSHGAKDKAVVRTIAERLRQDGLRVWFEGWEIKRVLVLCLSANTSALRNTLWENQSFRFRDPVNTDRHFLLLRLDVTPLNGWLAQYSFIDWLSEDHEQAYAKIVDICRPRVKPDTFHLGAQRTVLLNISSTVEEFTFSADQRFALSGSFDNTMRLWDVETGQCLRVLEGHENSVSGIAWSPDQRFVLSGGNDRTMRLWDLGQIASKKRQPAHTSAPDQVQYINAKVLVVGDTSAGKTGLAHRLATGEWKPSDGSTVGAWSTQWSLAGVSITEGLEQEIWLWDFGGQADQRLVHQLYMDRTALILLLFDASKDEVLPGLREWQTALRRCVPAETPLLLVAGRINAGFKASRAKLESFAEEQKIRFFETSAKEGTNCQELSRAIQEGIPWGQMEKRTSPRIFKLIKDAILKLRDEGQVLLTFKELREMLWQRLPTESRFTDETLRTVIGLLDGPGAVKELDYGTYTLLQPEWINVYA